jgi:outer membrane murein-binding lipoprotein Lpp
MRFPEGFLAGAVLLAVVLCGCQTIEKVDPRKRASEEHTAQVRKLQLEVMRYADEYTGRTRESINAFQSGLQSADERLLTQNWKVQQASAAYTIASGPNPLSNALDMVVLASLSRMVIDDNWIGSGNGARTRNVQETYRSLEQGAWQLVEGGVLTPEQVTALHQSITQWRAQHPNVRAVAYIHFRDFAAGSGAAGEKNAGTASLLGIVGIDPLSNLDPAVQELAQTRQLAERAIYYMQRAPDLLDMQVERLSYQFAAMPETRSLLGSVDRVSLIGSSSDRLVDDLPGLLDHERQALVAQLTETLNSQSATLGNLAGQLRSALQAGTDTATAVNGALQTFERISGQFAAKPGAAAEKPQPPGPPFDIRHYTEMLEQAAVTARELETLAQRSDVLVPALRSATADAGSQVRLILNHLFVLVVLLVLVIAIAALAVALAYRRLTKPPARAAA